MARGVALALVAVALVAGLSTRPPVAPGFIGVALVGDASAGAPRVRIETVLPESPASAAGLHTGDVIRTVRDHPVRVARDVTERVRRTRPGNALPIRIARGGATLDVTLHVAARPADADHRFEADRDEWQQPDRVLGLLGVGPGAQVADVGAGAGYFTDRLAMLVGADGRVIAVDIDPDTLAHLVTRFAGTRAVVVQRGLPADPRLPAASVDAVLMADTFHEVAAPDAMLAAIRTALRPGGRLVVVDRPADEWVPDSHTIPERRVVAAAEAAGFRVQRREELPRQFALVLEPTSAPPAR